MHIIRLFEKKIVKTIVCLGQAHSIRMPETNRQEKQKRGETYTAKRLGRQQAHACCLRSALPATDLHHVMSEAPDACFHINCLYSQPHRAHAHWDGVPFCLE
jgi:hypothetical protein